MRAATKAVVKLFFTIYGERGGFFVMEWTARVVVLALLFQLYTRVDEIDDVGARQQVIDKNTWDSSSHRPRLFIFVVVQVAVMQPEVRRICLLINENKPRIPFGSTALQLQLGLQLRAMRPQQISTDEYGVRFREPVSSRDVSQRML
ncbi:Hypothetical protein AKI40_0682 [Enterobacter sp. FY-07]|nr:Hypothetical protein AKI40_0682 [Enterobacter sp. FY-07]